MPNCNSQKARRGWAVAYHLHNHNDTLPLPVLGQPQRKPRSDKPLSRDLLDMGDVVMLLAAGFCGS